MTEERSRWLEYITAFGTAIAAIAASAAAIFAAVQIITSSNYSKIQYRAYLSAHPADQKDIKLSEIQDLNIIIEVKNVGSTPAQHIDVLEFADSETPSLGSRSPVSSHIIASAIGAGEVVSFGYDIDRDKLDENIGKKWYKIFGISYIDIFGAHHNSYSCLEFVFEEKERSILMCQSPDVIDN